MQKLKLLLFFLIFQTINLSSQETPKTQEFADLLWFSHFFEAFEYYEKYETEINNENSFTGKTLYDAYKAAALNEYDTSIPNFNNLFENIYIDIKYTIIEFLANFSFNALKYKDAAYTFDMLIEMLENNEAAPPNQDKSDLIKRYKQLRDLCSLLDQEDNMTICFNDSSRSVVNLDQEDNLPMIPVQVNQKQINAIFDTGCSPTILTTKQMADSMGIRVVMDEINIPLNKIPTNMAYGILDSLKINNLTVYNLVAMIIDTVEIDQEHYHDIRDKMDWETIIIGLPFMKQIGEVILDFENEKLILSAKQTYSKDNYNMLMYGNNLYLRSSINNILHIGIIDTGSCIDEITVNNQLYIRYKDKFGAFVTHYTDTTNLISHKNIRDLGVFENLKWSLPNQQSVIDISERSRVRLDTENQDDRYDAFYGFLFMQRFKKVVFDFNRMEFRYDYDPDWDAAKKRVSISLEKDE